MKISDKANFVICVLLCTYSDTSYTLRREVFHFRFDLLVTVGYLLLNGATLISSYRVLPASTIIIVHVSTSVAF